MQDFTGVPAIVDLAAMRDAMADLGGDPAKINPLVPAELVIDHSVQVDAFGTRDALPRQRRARVRAQPGALRVPALGPDGVRGLRGRPAGHRHRPPGQPRVPRARGLRERTGCCYPDTLVGTDSHTTMINGLGVLGWGVGGIEAEAAMLGQPMSMLIPRVVGFKLDGELPEGATATDLVLTVTQMLREHGVVGKFVEFYGAGVANTAAGRPRDDRQHEPGVRLDLRDLPDRRRDAALPARSPAAPRSRCEIVEAYARAQGLWHDENSEEPTYSETLELDLGDVVPSLAGPKRPQDRVSLTESKSAFRGALEDILPDPEPDRAHRRRHRRRRGGRGVLPGLRPARAQRQRLRPRRLRRSRRTARASQVAERVAHAVPFTMEDGTETELDHGHVVIAAITSCTNTSNPSVMIAAGLLARNARRARPAVQAVGEDVARAGLEGRHGVLRARPASIELAGGARLPPRRLRLHDVHRQLRARCRRRSPTSSTPRTSRSCPCSRGNRNFEGRINPDVKMNYLASPPLVVAYALAGTMDIDLLDEPLGAGLGRRGRVPQGHLALAPRRSRDVVEASVHEEMFQSSYGDGLRGRRALAAASRSPRATASPGTSDSTYVRRPSFLEDIPKEPTDAGGHRGRARARQARRLGHDRPHLARPARSRRTRPRGEYLQRARRRAEGLQLLRLAPRQPRGDGARHVRQHPPAQPARAGHRGRRHAPHARRRGDVDLRRVDQVRRGERRRWSCSRARSTAPARRATGRPRARTCSACAR